MSEQAILVGPQSARKWTRASIWLILAVALVAGIGTLVGGVLGLVDEFRTGGITITLMADKPVPDMTVVTDGGNTMHVVFARFPAADLTLQGASPAVVTLTVISDVSLLLTQVALCALVALLAWRILRGGVFRRSLSVTVTAAGAILAIGGLLSQASNAFGGALAASELNGGGRGFWPLAGRFDPTLTVFGFILLLVGLAFEYGSRLQKDTEGLI